MINQQIRHYFFIDLKKKFGLVFFNVKSKQLKFLNCFKLHFHIAIDFGLTWFKLVKKVLPKTFKSPFSTVKVHSLVLCLPKETRKTAGPCGGNKFLTSNS